MIRLFGYPALPSTDAAADRRVDEAGVLTFGLSASGHGLSTVTCAPGEAGAIQPVEDRCR
jgi:hypothetical protein